MKIKEYTILPEASSIGLFTVNIGRDLMQIIQEHPDKNIFVEVLHDKKKHTRNSGVLTSVF